MYHSIAAFLCSLELIRNLFDRTKYPEGHCCLCAWAYVIVGVVGAVLSGLSIIAYNRDSCSGNGCDVPYWSAAVSMTFAGLMFFGWSVYGSGKCPTLLAAWHVGRRLYVVISV